MLFSSSGKCIWTIRKSGALLCLSVDEEPENSLISLHASVEEGLTERKSRNFDFPMNRPCLPHPSNHSQRIPASHELQKIATLCDALLNLSHAEVHQICGFPDFIVGDKYSGVWGFHDETYKEFCIAFEKGKCTEIHWTPAEREMGKYLEKCILPSMTATAAFVNQCKYFLVTENDQCKFVFESHESEPELIHAVYWTPDPDPNSRYEHNIPLDFFRIRRHPLETLSGGAKE